MRSAIGAESFTPGVFARARRGPLAKRSEAGECP
jgi:hypothetical protein